MTKVKVLLVDDLEENLLSLAALLRNDELELLQARSGAEALELLLVHEVALALLDVQMPELDGFELAEMLRSTSRTRDIPLIFVTANGTDRHRIFKGYECGAVDFLQKPIEPQILRSKVGIFVELYRQRQQLATELQQRTEALRVNEMFLAVLGHDLRSPLTAVLNSAVLLRNAAHDPGTVQRTAARIERSAGRMQRLIEDLLDFARVRQGKGVLLKPEPMNLATVVQRIVQEQTAIYADRAIDFEATGALDGEWDPERLGQITANLLGNALQHGSPDQPVGVSLDGRDGNNVLLTVRNGGHIPEEAIPRLFDPFNTGGGGPREGGVGLGLFIVEQLVQAHGGKVEVKSSAVDGTMFRVSLPRGVSGTMPVAFVT